jgi:hypothetical protein
MKVPGFEIVNQEFSRDVLNFALKNASSLNLQCSSFGDITNLALLISILINFKMKISLEID